MKWKKMKSNIKIKFDEKKILKIYLIIGLFYKYII